MWLVPLLAGASLIILFCVRALHARNPLLDVRLWAFGGYRVAAIVYFCGAAVIFGSMFLLPLYFQDVRGMSPVATGLLLFPQGVGSAVGTFAFGRLSDRFGSGGISAAGATIACAATLPFIALGADTPYAPLVVLMVVRGFGLGMTTMPIMTAAFRAVGPARVSDVAPQLNVLQRVGAVARRRHPGRHAPARAKQRRAVPEPSGGRLRTDVSLRRHSDCRRRRACPAAGAPGANRQGRGRGAGCGDGAG